MTTSPRRPRKGRRVFAAIVVALLLALLAVYHGGRHRGPGVVARDRLPPSELAARGESQRRPRAALEAPSPARQILFGDLHVHTTFSADAFMRSLPIMHGEGAHPPADACDYARYCSSLDFFALTDHAESLSPAHWAETRETVRQCNAAAGPANDPDLVAFTGFEWTQVGRTPAEHFGHKNVIFRETDDAHLPARPIAAGGALPGALRGQSRIPNRALILPITDYADRLEYLDALTYVRELRGLEPCPEGVSTRLLPRGCRETAATPRVLFDKLDEWGFDAIVIPHGSTWGFYTPPGYRYAAHLTREHTDPRREFLIEVYSGHGNSEEYRTFHEVEYDARGAPVCPAPRRDYEPCCHRAGEIVRARCGTVSSAECERRVNDARRNYLAAGISGYLTVPGATVDDWGDCGQCRDCFDPSFNFRPGGSVQAIVASGDFSDPRAPRYQPWGFIASSDNHSARPGTGYKEIHRRELTEATGARDEAWHERLLPPSPRAPASDPLTPEERARTSMWQQTEFERQGSFFLTGGLVAVHAEGRDRDAIWRALQRREVYGTSGERILLWFDLVNAPGATSLPMGAQTAMSEPPRFEVRAAGSFVQRPGCPADRAGPSAERLQRLCQGECYNPGDARHRITRIEVVRIRPQRSASEPIDGLIEDHWRALPCDDTGAGCRVSFEDPDFIRDGRQTLYYVRAIQEPTPAINAANLRCERDAEGRCVRTHPCFGDYRTPFSDDCLGPNEERAWSSPIALTPRGP
ncbi:MAG: DUF3604 domain-containing protein [Polyangiales bacterium]